MTWNLRARARLRALLSVLPIGASAGALLGLTLGGAFLAGGMARDAVVHGQVTRIAADLDGEEGDPHGRDIPPEGFPSRPADVPAR